MKMIECITAAVFCIGLTAGQATAASCSLPANANSLASEMATSVNANRAAQGLPPLNYNAALGQAAVKHACDMATNGVSAHTGSDGSTARSRVGASGYQGCTVAENIAWGYSGSARTFGLWMGSAAHRNNILDTRVSDMGIGVTQGARGANWVLVLANRC